MTEPTPEMIERARAFLDKTDWKLLQLGEDTARHLAAFAQSEREAAMEPRIGTSVSIEHDGFSGTVQGYYKTREGKRGVVLQQHGTRVVHVYGEKWLASVEASKDKGP